MLCDEFTYDVHTHTEILKMLLAGMPIGVRVKQKGQQQVFKVNSNIYVYILHSIVIIFNNCIYAIY